MTPPNSTGYAALQERITADAAPEAAGLPRATAHVIALGELPDAAESGEHVLAGLPNPLHQVKVRLQVSVGEVGVTIGELLAAQQHQVFVLDRGVDQPVDVFLEGRVVARGQLVAVDDRFAVRITQLPIPLKA